MPGYSPYGGPPQRPRGQGNGLALTSLILGCIAIVAWCCPLIGFPLTIAGLVLGVVGLNSDSRGMAIAGIVLNAIFLLASVANAIAGVIINLNNLNNGF